MRKEQQARIVALAYGEQWPLLTIAAQLGLSYPTVRHVVARAAPNFMVRRDAERHDRAVQAGGDLRTPCGQDEGGGP